MSAEDAANAEGNDVRALEEARHAAPLRQAAYEHIEDLLNSGALRPGQMITQRELVRRTGATLGAVREAIPRLEAEGLIVTVPQRGLMVPPLDIAFVREAYQMRRLIELGAVSEFLSRRDCGQLTDWIAWHEAMRERLTAGASDQDLADEIQRRDWQMHAWFVAAMQNGLVDNVYRVTAIKTRMVVQSRIQVTNDNAVRVIGEHLDILYPMREGDLQATRAALSRHLDNSLKLALGGSGAL